MKIKKKSKKKTYQKRKQQYIQKYGQNAYHWMILYDSNQTEAVRYLQHEYRKQHAFMHLKIFCIGVLLFTFFLILTILCMKHPVIAKLCLIASMLSFVASVYCLIQDFLRSHCYAEQAIEEFRRLELCSVQSEKFYA